MEKTEDQEKGQLRIGVTDDNLVAIDIGHEKMAAITPLQATEIAMQLLIVAVGLMKEKK